MDHIRGLRYGPLTRSATHICVDMQGVFAKDSPWASSAVQEALPAVTEICRRKAPATIFTRFRCPSEVRALKGQWARFYAECPEILKLDPQLFDVIPELTGFTANADIIDRAVFSIFQSGKLAALLQARGADTLVFSGVETDVCVLASVLSAIDWGYRVIVVEEGVASSNKEGHAAALAGIFPRFDQQIELVGVSEALRAWN